MSTIKLYYSPGKWVHDPGPDEYPLATICAAVGLLCLSPFISGLLVYPALLLCLLRMVMYDVRVFGMDIAVLSSFATLFRMSSGDSLLAYYVIAGAIWFTFRHRQWWIPGIISLLVLLAHLVLRMNGQLVELVLVFSGLLALQLVVLNQNRLSVAKMSGAYCAGLLVSCVYSLILRNTWQLKAILGKEVPAYFGSTSMRFQGLFQDPNYFALFLILGILLLFRLNDYGYIKKLWCWGAIGAFCLCGVLTYSKTFFLFLVLTVLLFVVVLFKRKKRVLGLSLVLVGAIAAAGSVFTVIGERLTSATSFNELTTGRIELYGEYLEVITQNARSVLFGLGLDAPYLRLGPHNLYLEITYYIGIVGLVLYTVYFGMLLSRSGKQFSQPKTDKLIRYAVPVIMLMIYFTLQGMPATTFYILMAVAISSVRMERHEE